MSLWIRLYSHTCIHTYKQPPVAQRTPAQSAAASCTGAQPGPLSTPASIPVCDRWTHRSIPETDLCM